MVDFLFLPSPWSFYLVVDGVTILVIWYGPDHCSLSYLGDDIKS